MVVLRAQSTISFADVPESERSHTTHRNQSIIDAKSSASKSDACSESRTTPAICLNVSGGFGSRIARRKPICGSEKKLKRLGAKGSQK
jgi:hypothetical protein